MKQRVSTHGVLVFSPTHLEDLIAELAKEQIPHMVYAPTGYDMNRVSDRRHHSFYQALKIILDRGKKRLLLVTRDPHNLWYQDLLRAWEEAHRKVGMVPEPDQVLTWKEGDPPPRALLGHEGPTCDGLVTTDSLTMVQLREQLDHRGVKLGVYLSFEDHPRFSTMDPPVSAVRLPVLKIGETLMASLYQMIQFGYRGDTRVDLDCELVLRNEI
jgi:DNA-binding LacI/PurR family transcriptional regulator